MRHYCMRCGEPSVCHYSGWADRHPAAAVCAAVGMTVAGLLFASFFIAAMVLYPLTCMAFGALCLVGGAGAWMLMHDERTKAVVRRFDWETERERHG